MHLSKMFTFWTVFKQELISNIENDPKGGPEDECINTDILQFIRQNCHGKVIHSEI